MFRTSSVSNSLAFVIPHYRTDSKGAMFLESTIRSLLDQTDSDWAAIIVNDGCTESICGEYISDVARQHPERISVVSLPKNGSTGYARNAGIQYAASIGTQYILFQDDDDLAHPRRVEVTRRIFSDRADVDFIYSGFIPIDEHDNVLERSSVRLDMLEVLEALEREIVEGEGAWIRMATSTGFIATTSTVAVRTALALATPFPYGCYSEDFHTWFRMSASGARFFFAGEIPTRYRMPVENVTALGCNGREPRLLAVKVRNDVDGFMKAVDIAIGRGEVSPAQVESITEAFFARLASCIERQGDHQLAHALRRVPRNVAELIGA